MPTPDDLLWHRAANALGNSAPFQRFAANVTDSNAANPPTTPNPAETAERIVASALAMAARKRSAAAPAMAGISALLMAMVFLAAGTANTVWPTHLPAPVTADLGALLQQANAAPAEPARIEAIAALDEHFADAMAKLAQLANDPTAKAGQQAGALLADLAAGRTCRDGPGPSELASIAYRSLTAIRSAPLLTDEGSSLRQTMLARIDRELSAWQQPPSGSR
jgi:hypothetical protein